MESRFFVVVLLIILLLFGTTIYLFTFTPLNAQVMDTLGLVPPTPTPTPLPTPTPIPTPTPTAIPLPTPTPRGMMPQVQARAIYMIDGNNNTVLANINANTPFPMASTAKIMTAIITLGSVGLDQKVTIPQDAVDHAVNASGSSAYLVQGDVIKVHELLYGLLLPSGADAATALADYVSGSTPAFVQAMNNKAAALGLTNTHFVDPDGLTIDGTVSTTSAVDLTNLANYALGNATFATIVQQTAHDLPATQFHHKYHWDTTNGLLTSFPGVIGVKTGHSSVAGYCLAFAASRNGHYLIGAILGSSQEEQRNIDVGNLLNWGFFKLGSGAN